MRNPISPSTRSKIYLVGEIISDVIATVTGIFVLLGYVELTQIAILVSALITKIVSRLARKNITTGAELEEEDPAEAAAEAAVESDLQFVKIVKEPRHRAETTPIGPIG